MTARQYKSRIETADLIEQVIELHGQNYSFREIAKILGYKSAGYISDLMRTQGHYSVILTGKEIRELRMVMDYVLNSHPENILAKDIYEKLSKVRVA